ncbi:MAG: integration host factor subunit beta [Mariniblastus sp.]|nr:integration host factor subunit beta [Mariniblastus sp.]
MTKKEIVKTISEEMGETQLRTKEIVQRTFDAIIETLVTEGRIELRNFGVFEVKKRAARNARNPRTGDKVQVPEKYVVTFKPGKEMEARVREMEVGSIPLEAAPVIEESLGSPESGYSPTAASSSSPASDLSGENGP